MRLRNRPLGLLAAGLVGLEAALAAVGVRVPGLSALVLVVAPGLAVIPLLPLAARRAPLAALAAAPCLGFAAASVALISLSRAGIAVDASTSRCAVAAVVVCGLAIPVRRELEGAVSLAEAAGLGVALAIGIVLQDRVIGGSPVPGNDWAKYVLYADEIRRQGGVLIRNPYWMLGSPFRDDPGVPAVYGAFLDMSGAPAGLLVHGIWVFAVMGILGVFAWVRALWNRSAAILAAALWSVLPIDQDILGWHGLANVAALGLMCLIFMQATVLARDGLGRGEAAGLALALGALAATHRLSAVIGLGVLAVAGTIAVVTGADRRRLLAGVLCTAVMGVVLCPLVASDLIAREATFGGTLPYTAYLNTKVPLGPLASDLTWPFVIVSLIAAAVELARLRVDRRLFLSFLFLACDVALAYAWLVHLPLAYLRMAYYLPLALVPITAVAMARSVALRRWAVGGCAALVGAMAALAWPQAANVRGYYGFTDAASLRGLDALAANLRPGEPVVTDRCWSFLATWLLHTRTLAALLGEDIGPAAELAPAHEAQSILTAGSRARTQAARLGIRYAVVDPTCTDAAGRALPPPAGARPLYASSRLVILRLASGAAGGASSGARATAARRPPRSAPSRSGRRLPRGSSARPRAGGPPARARGA